MEKCCSNFVIADHAADKLGPNHHPMCPQYAQKKYRRIFYLDDGIDRWAPLDELIVELEAESRDLGEIFELQFKVLEMTDKEFVEIPHC